jgi:hypothetical protein
VLVNVSCVCVASKHPACDDPTSCYLGIERYSAQHNTPCSYSKSEAREMIFLLSIRTKRCCSHMSSTARADADVGWQLHPTTTERLLLQQHVQTNIRKY